MRVFSAGKNSAVALILKAKQDKSEHHPTPACYLNFIYALINREHTKKGKRETSKNTKALYLDSGSVNNRCPIIWRGKTTTSLIVGHTQKQITRHKVKIVMSL